MTYAMIHQHLTPYPAPTSTGAIDYACAMAKLFEAKLSASSSHLKIRSPENWLTGMMMAKMARELEVAAAEKTAALENHLKASAQAAGIDLQLTAVSDRWPVGVMDNSWRARVSDVCVLGLSPLGEDARFGIEDWLFGAGRPCILYPDSSTQTFSLDHILICWDQSRSAARTVSDALPLLHNAKRVTIAVFRGEKDIPVENAGKLLATYLAEHGVAAEAEEVDIGKRTIGQAILEHAETMSAKLVIMGAYGHSRFNEFLLGGATKHVLDKSTIPILMSH